MVVSDGFGEAESRFTHLLQPIRDLTKNWDVDIASQLEEYLEEVEKISVTFDGGTTTMNFAEAALLIQGSACVYSRKVEYLYNLVYQVLDLLASKKKMQQATSVDADGNDADATTVRKNQDDEYLTLDDIKLHKNIEKRSDDFDTLVQTVPRTPMALVKVDELDKGENPLLSRTGEVLGSRKDFKMNTCNVGHPSGTILLDLSHLSLLEFSLASKPSSTPYIAAKATARIDTDLLAHGGENPAPELDKVEDEGLQDMSVDAGLDLLEMDDHNDEDPLPPEDLPPVQEQKDQMALRQRKVNFALPEKQKVDPWISLDPHESGTIADKPFKRTKTFCMPPCLEANSNKKRKRKKEPVAKIKPISEFIAENYHSCASMYPSNKLKVPDFPEFEQLYWVEFKRRQAKLKQERKMMLQRGQYEDLAEEEQEQMEDDNHQDGGGILAGDDDDDNQEVDYHLPLGQDPLHLASVIEDNIPTDVVPPDDGDAEEAPIVNSYEELVRHHVEGFLASAQEYAQLTDLSKRVSEWEDKVLPRLQEEEEHEPFDIHLYGTRVLDSVEKNDKEMKKMTGEKAGATKVPFREVVKHKQPFEVCRMFLATLQLANNYNVEISVDGKLEKGVDTMSLQYLSRKRHFEELQDYRAPSVDS